MTSHDAEFDEAQVEQEVMRILDEFVRSTNARETERHVAILHHPHYRLAHGVMTIHDTAEEAIRANAKFFEEVVKTEWHLTEWIHRRIVQIGESLAHVDGRFVRLRKDGSEIDTLDAIYVLTKQDGHWGIKLRSSFL
ncbi:MAG: DUF6841 family protein [Gammaproteobacteria bacterium]